MSATAIHKHRRLGTTQKEKKERETLTRRVLIEERIMIRAVQEYGRRSNDPQAPRHGAVAADASAVEGRIAEGRVGRERRQRVGGRLEVGRLGLQLRRVDVCGARELVVVQRVVLHCRANEPHGPGCRFDQQPASCVDVGLRVGRVVDVVVGGPVERVGC